jgi:hypothetical protein
MYAFAEGSGLFVKLSIHWVNCESASSTIVIPSGNSKLKSNIMWLLCNVTKIVTWRMRIHGSAWQHYSYCYVTIERLALDVKKNRELSRLETMRLQTGSYPEVLGMMPRPLQPRDLRDGDLRGLQAIAEKR